MHFALDYLLRRFDTLSMQPGPEQLRDWMRRRSFNQAETAAHMGMDFTYISQIVNGVRTPGLVNALIIERHTGIPVEAWTETSVGESELTGARTRGNRKQGKA